MVNDPTTNTNSDLPDIIDEPMVMPDRIMGIDVDPAARLIPGSSRRQFQELTEDVDAQGLLHPVARFRGRWLDGRLRLMACEALEITPTIIDLPDDTDPVAYVMSANAQRRHLTKSQIAMAVTAARAVAKLWAKSGSNQHSGGGEPGSTPATNESMANEAGVSVKTIQQAKIVYQAGLDQEVMSGQKTLKQAVKAARNYRSDEQSEREARTSDRASTKKPRLKLPEDVLELQRQLRDREDVIDELSKALDREQATTKKLRADCDQLKRENAALKAKDVPDVRDWIEAAFVNDPELVEVLEALDAVDESPVREAVMDDVVQETAVERVAVDESLADMAEIDDVAPEEAAVEQAAVDEAVQDSEQAEALLGPPSPLAIHHQNLIHAFPGHKKPDHLDPKRERDNLVIEAEDILEIEGRLQHRAEVSATDSAAYFAYLEANRLAAAAAGQVVVQEQVSILAMLPVGDDTVPVRSMVIQDEVAPSPKALTPELAERWVATKLLAPGLESSVRVTEETIDFAAYLGHTVALVEA